MLEYKESKMDAKITKIMFNFSVTMTLIAYIKASVKRPKAIPSVDYLC